MPKTNFTIKLIFPAIIFFAVFAIAGSVQAATYYVDANLSADCTSGNYSIANRTCNGSSGNAYNTITDVNSRLQPGDTAYIRGGTYAQQIAPVNSGTGENARITYARYQSEEIIISSTEVRQADLRNKSFITLDGLKFRDAPTYWVDANYSSHCIFKNCDFYNAYGYQGFMARASTYNTWKNNTFSAGACGGTESGVDGCPYDLLSVDGDLGDSHHHLIESNTFGNCSHYAVSVGYGLGYTIVRDNTVENKWHGGIGGGSQGGDVHLLIENNMIRNCGIEADQNPWSMSSSKSAVSYKRGIQLYADQTRAIVRNNILYNNGSNYFASSFTYNYIYNNVFDSNYYQIRAENDLTEIANNQFKNNSISRADTYGIYWGVADNTNHLNYFTNNNWYQNADNRFKQVNATDAQITGDFNGSWASEFSGNVNLDPAFTNWNLQDYLQDYSLTSSSSLIDAGTWLTLTNGTGTDSTTLIVDDANYFAGGWGVPGEPTYYIQIEGQSTPIAISSIDYANNRITLATPATWADDKGVSFPFEGSAPDIGAKEYGGGTDTQAPNTPSGLSVR